MTGTTFDTYPSQQADVAHRGGRLKRVGENVKLLMGLLAIYAPVVLVLLLVRGGVLGKTYFVWGIWAIERIVWYCYYIRALNRRARDRGRTLYDV